MEISRTFAFGQVGRSFAGPITAGGVVIGFRAGWAFGVGGGGESPQHPTATAASAMSAAAIEQRGVEGRDIMGPLRRCDTRCLSGPSIADAVAEQEEEGITPRRPKNPRRP